MSPKWIIAIVIVLGFLALGANERGIGSGEGGGLLSFLAPATLSNEGDSGGIEDSADTNGNGILSADERRRALERISDGLDEVSESVRDYELERFASPFRGAATLRAGSARTDDYAREHLTLDADRDNTTLLPISGWRLESQVSGKYVTVGDGASAVRFRARNTTSPILLSPSDRVILATGSSPLSVSFAVNKCSGYLEENKTFYPSLGYDCPLLEDENLAALGITPRALGEDDYDECIDYIEGLSRCRHDRGDDTLDRDCRAVINRETNYNACVERHKNDFDFLSGEWRVHFGRRNDLWDDEHDTIYILDQNGLIVDFVSY